MSGRGPVWQNSCRRPREYRLPFLSAGSETVESSAQFADLPFMKCSSITRWIVEEYTIDTTAGDCSSSFCTSVRTQESSQRIIRPLRPWDSDIETVPSLLRSEEYTIDTTAGDCSSSFCTSVRTQESSQRIIRPLRPWDSDIETVPSLLLS